jgi:hypothetical protein
MDYFGSHAEIFPETVVFRARVGSHQGHVEDWLGSVLYFRDRSFHNIPWTERDDYI